MEIPQTQVDEQFWRHHTERLKSYDGTIAAYCRLHNLDFDKLRYYRGLQAGVKKKKSKSSVGFAKVKAVQPSQILKSKISSQLPDPKWLAELIHNLASH